MVLTGGLTDGSASAEGDVGEEGRVGFRGFRGEAVPVRSGPRIVDSVLSEISTGFQAAVFTATCSKYTASGVRRSSAV